MIRARASIISLIRGKLRTENLHRIANPFTDPYKEKDREEGNTKKEGEKKREAFYSRQRTHSHANEAIGIEPIEPIEPIFIALSRILREVASD